MLNLITTLSAILGYIGKRTHLFGSADSGLLAHPVPSLGTSETLGSLPLFSAFKLGRLAGGGMRRAEATLPRDCKPWRGATTKSRPESVNAALDGAVLEKQQQSRRTRKSVQKFPLFVYYKPSCLTLTRSHFELFEWLFLHPSCETLHFRVHYLITQVTFIFLKPENGTWATFWNERQAWTRSRAEERERQRKKERVVCVPGSDY